jgi:hypothetical protein
MTRPRRRGTRWLRPAPSLLALLLVAILSVIWSFALGRFLRADARGHP